MKIKQLILALMLVAIAMPSCKKSGNNVKLTNSTDSMSYCLGVLVGANVKQMDITDINEDLFAIALKEAAMGKESKIKPEAANAFLQNYSMQLQAKQGEKNLQEGKDFLKANGVKTGVKTTASGLQYEVIKDGTGPQPKADDNVTVNYTGTLIDGTVFDSSIERGQPAQFPLNRVIPGWSEAIQLMKVGAKYKVYIPSELGYGMQAPQGSKIKPNMALIFEIELLSIDPKTQDNGGQN